MNNENPDDGLRHAPVTSMDTEIQHPLPPASQPEPSAEVKTPVLLLLLAAFLLPGLIGRDPWKPDEGYFFGMVHSLLQGGDWLVPTLAGEPFMEKPPLIMWLGALFAKLTAPLLAPHDGARLAIGLCMAVTVLAVGAAARRALGVGNGRVAALTLLTSLGILLNSHMLIADIPLMMGVAIALCGYARILEQPVAGGVLLGCGVGAGFLAKGLLAPGVIGVAGLLLPLIFPQWRSRNYLRGLAVAVAVALPWLVVWPALLYLRSPTLFAEWFWQNNIGRYLGFSVAQLGATNDPGYWQRTLPWFTFPLWPLAAWTLWQERRALRARHLPAASEASLLVLLVTLAVLTSSASARVIYALSLLPPLAILAAPALTRMSARVHRSIDWAARLTAGGICLVLWYAWLLTLNTGVTPAWLQLTQHFPGNYPFAAAGSGMVCALLLAVLWIILLFRLKALRNRGLVSWVAAVALLWGTVATLWFPWIDIGKSYRATFQQLQAALPEKRNCLTSHGLGESERGLLHYFTGILTIRHELRGDPGCDFVLVQSIAGEVPWWQQHGWRVLWHGNRPGDRRERFWLFARPSLVN